MPLTTGTTLGPYSVIAKIGAGGMGEVYRARDTTLDRDVAIKVLPDTFAGDPDRLARFQREAQVLASLNHPNIRRHSRPGRSRRCARPRPAHVSVIPQQDRNLPSKGRSATTGVMAPTA